MFPGLRMEIPESDPDESCLSLAVFVLKKNPQKVKMMKFSKNKTLDRTISRILLTTIFGYTHCQEIQGETLQLLYLFATWMNALGSQQRASALVAR